METRHQRLDSFYKLVILGLFLAIISACSSNPQSTPESTISYAIKLLENKNTDELIDNLMDPSFKTKMSAEKIARIKKQFGKSRKAKQLLDMLKNIKNKSVAKTVVSDSKVVYRPTNKGRPLRLIKVENKWYIQN